MSDCLVCDDTGIATLHSEDCERNERYRCCEQVPCPEGCPIPEEKDPIAKMKQAVASMVALVEGCLRNTATRRDTETRRIDGRRKGKVRLLRLFDDEFAEGDVAEAMRRDRTALIEADELHAEIERFKCQECGQWLENDDHLPTCSAAAVEVAA